MKIKIDWSVFFERFQALMIGLGVIVGGCWTYFVYDDLQQNRKSEFEIQKLKRELDGSLSLTIDVDVKQAKKKIDGKYGVFIDVKYKNNSSRDILVNMDDSLFENRFLKIYRRNSAFFKKFELVTIGAAYIDVGYEMWDTNRVDYTTHVLSFVVPPFREGVLHYFVDVDRPGIYWANMNIPIDDSTAAKMEENMIYQETDSLNLVYADSLNSRRPKRSKSFWTISKYFEVE